MKAARRFAIVLAVTASSALIAASTLAGVLVDDNFSDPKLAKRDLSPSRGEWKFDGGIATCTQDDELYKKNKDHGPVIWYDTPFTDATIRFSLKPQDNKTFVFTLNNEKGHVFRFVTTKDGTSVRAWPSPGKDSKPEMLLKSSAATPKLSDGEWTPVSLQFTGTKCTLAIGAGFKQTFEHAAIANNKTKLGLGFSFGTLSLKEVKVETPDRT